MSFVKNTAAASMVEYGLLVGLISVVAIASIELLGTNVNNLFSTAAGKLASAANA